MGKTACLSISAREYPKYYIGNSSPLAPLLSVESISHTPQSAVLLTISFVSVTVQAIWWFRGPARAVAGVPERGPVTTADGCRGPDFRRISSHPGVLSK
ncbi:MAG: hypothetical protein RBS80_06240 [Thermoguttaceae bacterium]|jgi:hypothetical protein|nr:hypothetical protein [Thermoguttaceae bacterium]